MSDAAEFPMQPIKLDKHGTPRFVENRIVNTLLEKCQAHGYGLNQIASDLCRGNYTEHEMIQLAQLIGYSVSGFGDLSYAQEHPHIVEEADRIAEELLEEESNDG